MRGLALGILGASVAVLATASAFLLLASLGGVPVTSDPIPQTDPSAPGSPGPALVLKLPQDRLEELKMGPDQRLAVDVENGDDEELPIVNLALVVASENTTRPGTRYYWATTENVAPKEVATVEFEIDLSPPTPDENSEVGPRAVLPEDREMLEVRATTPGGASAIKTAVLTP
ncbi:MAG: hypothetical protein JOZ19_14155 [Rubrobacter sp.]|nr:hypothetical protein [Rubrobacter sp.]